MLPATGALLQNFCGENQKNMEKSVKLCYSGYKK